MKKWLKKGSAMLLTFAMVLSLFPGMNGTLATVQAAENNLPASGYWTDVEGLKKFSLDETSNTEGRIIFGQNGSGAAQQWKIAGTDSGIDGDNIILFAASPLGSSVFEDNYNINKSYNSNWNCTYPDDITVSDVYPNHYGSSDLRTVLNNYMSGNSYFSASEKTKMNQTTIYTDDTKNATTYSVTDTLYAPYGDYIEFTYFTVGTNTSDSLNGGVMIDISKCGDNAFWLRSPYDDNGGNALVADSVYAVDYDGVSLSSVSVVPAFDLNLSSVLFASAAEAASSSYSGFKANDTDNTMTANTYTLRYKSYGNESAVFNSSGTQVKVTNANGKYLMVQNSTGVYALRITSENQTVSASDIQMGNSDTEKLDNFNNCKVWIESTDENRITTAKMATRVDPISINSVAVTDIDVPVAGSALDTQAACATTGVATTAPTVAWAQGNASATGNAGYNTIYTASVILIAGDDYEFPSDVTATVDGQNATSVVKNENGTVTITYTFPVTAAKAVSNAYFATVDDLKECYNISDGTIGKIKFGLNGEDARLWAICGADGDNLALLSTSEFATGAYGGTSAYSKSNFVTNIDTYLGTTYFSAEELDKMADVTVSTNEPDANGGNHSVSVANKKLYLPNSQDQNSYRQKTIYVGSGNDIAIDVTKLNSENGFQTNYFWLRSPQSSYTRYALVANSGVYVYSVSSSGDNPISVVPALNLNLSSDIFASAADAASSSYSGYKANSAMKENTYTLRYKSEGTESAVISASGKKVTITNADGKYLMVQNSTGVYALAIDSKSKTVNASDIVMGSDASAALTNFNNCKVWIESTDENRITTAKMAIQATVISSVEVTGIDAPVAGSALDTQAACATTGVATTAPTVAWAQGNASATGNAGYNTTYTASVTLTAAEDYEFASDVTATVNEQNATSVVSNDDGTVTITYTFPTTAKAKLIRITAPTGITVANGTAYADMGLPANVAIVTEGNTETTAAIVWDTTSPASGSYNPAVLTEQSVTLNGTVTCPSNIDQNSVPLTTTITVTISAAGIVGTPTFTPAEGTYTENQSVTLVSSTDGATIYYTTDGTTPTTDSNVYSGAISVTGTAGKSISTTIKAIAVKSGMQTSGVTSATYVIELPAPEPSTYAVTVNNGTGDGSYAAGATVTITADADPSGQEFDKWTVVSGGVTLASVTSATTTFTMPANAVEVTAVYKNKPSDPNPPTPDATVSISQAEISGVSNKNYTGKAQTQSNLTLKIGNTTLKPNTDYTVSYSNNKNVGTATITIEGKGNYTGTVKKTFQITLSTGKTYTVSSMKYKVTNADTKGKGTVTLIGTTKKKTDKKFTSLSVGSTVKIGGVSFKITAIGDNAFKGYTKIEKVTVGNDVETIGKSAFSGCSTITTVTLGTRVKSIGASAFYNCKKLSKLTIMSNKLSSVGSKAIKNIKKNAIIDVPSSKVKDYKKLFKSSTGFKKTMKIK